MEAGIYSRNAIGGYLRASQSGRGLSPDIKSGNYLNNILGVAEAVELGADDCLMLDPAGLLTEASNSNVFFVIDGQLTTPNVESGVLRGITKAAIATLGEETGYPLHERKLPAVQLSRATECFATSTTREVMPVSGVRLESGEWRVSPRRRRDNRCSSLQRGGQPVCSRTVLRCDFFESPNLCGNCEEFACDLLLYQM